MNNEKSIYYNIAILLLGYFFLIVFVIPEIFKLKELAEILKNIGYGLIGFIYLIISLRKELQ